MKINIVFVMMVMTAVAIFSLLSSAQAPDLSICNGQQGAALGLCRAAVAAGCDDSGNQSTNCMRIARNFTRRTGNNPPWLLPSCPCFSTESLIAILDTDRSLFCGDNRPGGVNLQGFTLTGEFLFVEAFEFPIVNTYCVTSPPDVFQTTTDDQAEVCVATLLETADILGLTCGQGL